MEEGSTNVKAGAPAIDTEQHVRHITFSSPMRARQEAKTLTEEAARLSDPKDRRQVLRRALDLEVQALNGGKATKWHRLDSHESLQHSSASQHPKPLNGQQVEIRKSSSTNSADKSNTRPESKQRPAPFEDSIDVPKASSTEVPATIRKPESSKTIDVSPEQSAALDNLSSISTDISSTGTDQTSFYDGASQMSGSPSSTKRRNKPKKLEVRSPKKQSKTDEKKKPKKLEIRSPGQGSKDSGNRPG